MSKDLYINYFKYLLDNPKSEYPITTKFMNECRTQKNGGYIKNIRALYNNKDFFEKNSHLLLDNVANDHQKAKAFILTLFDIDHSNNINAIINDKYKLQFIRLDGKLISQPKLIKGKEVIDLKWKGNVQYWHFKYSWFKDFEKSLIVDIKCPELTLWILEGLGIFENYGLVENSDEVIQLFEDYLEKIEYGTNSGRAELMKLDDWFILLGKILFPDKEA